MRSYLDRMAAGVRGSSVDGSDDARRTAAALNRLFVEHKVQASVRDWCTGPRVTQFAIATGPGVLVRKVTELERNIAKDLDEVRIRITTVAGGKPGCMGIEVPRKGRPSTVSLPAILAGVPTSAHPLTYVLGVDVAGRPLVTSLAVPGRPHLLIAGATGAGKSQWLHSFLVSLLARATPDQVRLLLIDLKRVELAAYRAVPHLVEPVIKEVPAAIEGLRRAVAELRDRYRLLERAQVRDIRSYNRQARAVGRATLPYLVIGVDELADLVLAAKPKSRDDKDNEVERLLVELGALGRAAGIHLVLATQRPSVDVVTGLIKANVPARLAFATASAVDSRVVIDHNGAEKLLGAGDGLWVPDGAAPTRIQGAFVTDEEIAQVVESVIRHFGRPDFRADRPAPRVAEAPLVVPPEWTETAPPADVDRKADDEAGDDVGLLVAGVELVVRSQVGSTSMLQRKLRVGYAKAGRLMDLMQAAGIVGPPAGSKARDVLYTADDVEGALKRLQPPG